MMSVELVGEIHEKLPEFGVDDVTLIWHGGEPLIRGLAFYEAVVSIQKHLRQRFPNLRIVNNVQTNATLMTKEWAGFFPTKGWRGATSLDGPEGLHNTFRVDAKGRAEFDRVMPGIRFSQPAGVSIGFI